MNITEKDMYKFHSFESSNNLDEIIYKKRVIWPVIRYAVFYYIISDQYIYKNNFNVVNRVNKFSNAFKSLISLRKIFKPSNIIVFDGARNINIDGKQLNPTTYSFVESLSDDNEITIIDMHGLVKKNHYPKNEVIDISLFLGLFRVFSRFFKNGEWARYIQKINGYILKDYKKEVNLESIYSNVFVHQFALAFCTKLILKIKKPKIMAYSDNGSFSMAINCARKLNTITIDYQHSVVSSMNILYSHRRYLDKYYRTFLSEYIFSYGPYWEKYYTKHYKTLPVGSLQQELAINRVNDLEKDKNYITIVSGVISRPELIKLAIFISNALPNLKIYYKLRPEEYSNWHNFYPKEIKDISNIIFIDHEEHSLHYYLKKSEYVIGINSTVLIEAIPLSKVIVYRHGWSIEMNDIILAGMALEATSYDETVQIIINNDKPNNTSIGQDLFMTNVSNNIRSKISQIT
jgi:hypothetical protein